MSLQPPAQPQIVPWLAQPLPALVWAGLGVAALATAAAAIRVRRSAEPCPLSPRWLAVTVVAISGGLAAMAFGAGLLHPAAAVAAAVLVVAGAIVAWAGWHADPADRAGFAQANGLGFTLGVTLGLAAIPALFLNGTRWQMGLNAGEALACMLPAAGSPLAMLFLLPGSHPQTEHARGAVVVLTAAFLGTLTLATAGATLGVATPLPFESLLSERYAYVNATLATSSALMALSALAVGAVGWLDRRWAAAGSLAVLVVAVVAANSLTARWTDVPAYGQNASRSAVSLAAGLVLGAAAWKPARWAPFLTAVTSLIALVLAVRTAITAPSAGGVFAPLWNASLASCGFLAASVTVRRVPPEVRASRAFGQPVFLACAFTVIGVVACVLATRSSLIYQATEFSRGFHYDRLARAGEEFRRESTGHPHVLHIGGRRYAWVLPQATWWTDDYAWRDALIVTDRSHPVPPDPETTGQYYGERIVDEQGKPGDADFKDARYVAVTQPNFVGARGVIVQTTPVRTATLSDLAGWAGVSPSAPAVWFGLIVLGGVLSWFCVRPSRPAHSAAIAFALLLPVTAAAEGLAAAPAMLVAAAAVLALASARRGDQWRTPAVLGLLFGVALFLLPVIIRLGDH